MQNCVIQSAFTSLYTYLIPRCQIRRLPLLLPVSQMGLAELRACRAASPKTELQKAVRIRVRLGLARYHTKCFHCWDQKLWSGTIPRKAWWRAEFTAWVLSSLFEMLHKGFGDPSTGTVTLHFAHSVWLPSENRHRDTVHKTTKHFLKQSKSTKIPISRVSP